MRNDGRPSPVRPAHRSDLPDLVSLAAASTWDSPETAWLIPDADQRPIVLHAWYTMVIEQALRHGYADLMSDRRAAAIWLDRTRPLQAPSHYLRRLTASCGRHTISLLDYDHLLEANRPRSAHLRLAVLAATDPQSATALLTHRHRVLDQAGTTAYATVPKTEHREVLIATGYRPGTPLRLPGSPEIRTLQRPPGGIRHRSGRCRHLAVT